MRADHFQVAFVEYIPPMREDGVLYVSTKYKTAVHNCACGCGTKVVTPINPSQWRLSWDGDEISLSPSIGNWQFPCRSHYCVIDGAVRWSKPWSEERVLRGRNRDRDDRERYFRSRRGSLALDERKPHTEPDATKGGEHGRQART